MSKVSFFDIGEVVRDKSSCIPYIDTISSIQVERTGVNYILKNSRACVNGMYLEHVEHPFERGDF